jgi:predicted metal-dependent phosphoesterase TrpH
MSLRTADLHFHSLHSDGKHSVADLSRFIKDRLEADLELAVLTDHDGVAGFEEFSDELRGCMPLVCASELSCSFQDPRSGRDRELHLLVYGLDPSDEYLRSRFAAFREARRQRFFRICENFKAAGYDLDAEEIARRHHGVLGRPHIADALVEKGYVKTRQEAFEKFLFDGHPLGVTKWRLPLEEVCREAKSRGWRTSIAHPGQYDFRDVQLSYFKDLGVDALEIYHPRHNHDLYLYYNEKCKRFGFMATGGSDFHSIDSDQRSGVPSLGRVRYPYDQARQFLRGIL